MITKFSIAISITTWNKALVHMLETTCLDHHILGSQPMNNKNDEKNARETC
jgi:hypothetical protein